MNVLYTRRVVNLWCIASPLVCVGLRSLAHAQKSGAPPLRVFGMVHLTVNQVAHLHFANVPGVNLPDRPVRVQLEFLDSNGNILLQPETEVVMPGNITSLALSGDGLDFPADSSQVGVRAVVRFLDPQARGVATLEIEDNATASRFVLLDHGVIALAAPPQKLRICRGPASMRVEESARLTVVNEGVAGDPRNDAVFEVKLQIANQNFEPLVEKTVTLDFNQSASVDLPKYVGTIFGLATIIADRGCLRATATLESFDRGLGQHTARMVGVNCRGYSDTGYTGGGGY
jgi:putative transposon-encoded protein